MAQLTLSDRQTHHLCTLYPRYNPSVLSCLSITGYSNICQIKKEYNIQIDAKVVYNRAIQIMQDFLWISNNCLTVQRLIDFHNIYS